MPPVNGVSIPLVPLSHIRSRSDMKSRELLVDERMHERKAEYVDVRPLHFFVGTWNVNGQLPGASSLEPWLITSGGEPCPALYVVGFQELDLDKRAYLVESSLRETEWQKAVELALHKRAEYKLVRVIRLVGMMLLVYVLKNHEAFVANVAAAAVGTGIMGWMGNKGGVGVRFDFHGSELCFVTAHFAAHTAELERRNEDFRNICDKMVFNQLEFPRKIKDHDMIFWLGDFNYRISGLDRKAVQELISENRFSDLIDYDQLQTEILHQKVFHGFREGKIRFKPTYKYDTGTDIWDSSEKSRVPAWCDRILWKHKDGESVLQLSYVSRMEMRLSDHKPVVAMFEVGVKVVDRDRKKRVYEDVLKEIDREENLFIPQATIDQYDFHLGDVTFLQPIKKTLKITNTGEVPLVCEFIAKPDCTGYCKDWLKVVPPKRVVPLHETCSLELLVYVEKRTVVKLTTKEETLDDILVLHLEGGKDFFITIQGRYVPSCFGIPLQVLATLTEPVRSGPSKEATTTTDGLTSEELMPPTHVPLEVWMLLSQLSEVATGIPDLFLQAGPPDEVEAIRDHLDARLPLPLPGSAHSIAECLLLYFDALPEPLIPFNMYSECLDASSNLALCRQAVEKFPAAHRETFLALMVLLRELQHLWQQHPGSNDLGTLEVIADLIMRPPADIAKTIPVMGTVGRGAHRQMISKKKTSFIQQFLMHKTENEPVLRRETHSEK